jgi:hypothetical protein
MLHTDYRTLINRGRKAGLSTEELYNAIAARPPEVSDQSTGQTDGNGFVTGYDPEGRRVFRPASGASRS